MHIILIHGAWQGGWVWDAVVPALQAAGRTPHPVDLPGSAPDISDTDRAAVTFADQVEHLVDLTDGLEGDIAVVGHSGGGMAASSLAEARPDRIAGIVYVAGMMLPPGVKYPELAGRVKAEDPGADGIWPFLEHRNGLTIVPPDAAVEVFLQDADPEAARAVAERLTPMSNAARDVTVETTADRFGTVPRAYITALHDRSLVPAVQRLMQTEMPGAVPFEIDTGHAPMVADPDALTAMILEGIAGFGEKASA